MAKRRGQYSLKSVKEIAAKEGCSESKIRSIIRYERINRRGDQRRFRKGVIDELSKKGLTIEKIRKHKDVCEAFNKPDGKYVSKTTISHYIRMKMEDVVKPNDNRPHSVYNLYNWGKSSDLMLSSGTTKKCLQDIYEMHIEQDYIDCDLTYSIGNFYKNTGLPEPKHKYDKFPNPEYPDVHPLEEVNSLPDGCFKSIIVDPPFVIREKKEGVSNGKTVDRFGGYKDYNDLVESNRWLIATAGRLLKEEGILVYKIQDTCSSGKQVWTHTKIEQFATECHLEIKDIHLCDNQSHTSLKPGSVQKHARKAFSFIYTFKKVDERIQRGLERTYKKGLKALEACHYDEAIQLFTSSAIEGHRTSMIALGDMYYNGRGVEMDTYQAIHWLRQAAAKGSRQALVNLGKIYYDMERNPENDRLAWKYFSSAALLDGIESFYQGMFFYDDRIGFLSDQVGPYESIEEQMMDGISYFIYAFDDGQWFASIYLWKMYHQIDSEDLSEIYYRQGESRLKTPSDYNDWARVLCHEQEYAKALPYMEKCLSLAGKDNLQPSFLDTYGEILYGLGRLGESKEAFNKCLAITIDKDERRRRYEVEEKIRQKFPLPK